MSAISCPCLQTRQLVLNVRHESKLCKAEIIIQGINQSQTAYEFFTRLQFDSKLMHS